MRGPRGQSHIVNHNAFTDKVSTFGAEKSEPLRKGDPRYINPGPSNVAKSKGLQTSRY